MFSAASDRDYADECHGPYPRRIERTCDRCHRPYWLDLEPEERYPVIVICPACQRREEV